MKTSPPQNLGQILFNSLTRKWLLAMLSLATLLLTVGYLLGKLWLQTPVVFLIGLLWVVCVLRDFHRVASLLFVVMLGAAAVGYMARLSHILMLAAGCASIITWDLHQFEGRLLDLDEPATREMEKSHLLRTGLVFVVSFVIIAADSLLHVRFQFFYLIILTVVAVLVLNQIMMMVRRVGKSESVKSKH